VGYEQNALMVSKELPHNGGEGSGFASSRRSPHIRNRIAKYSPESLFLIIRKIVWGRDKVVINLPRRARGIERTLNQLTMKGKEGCTLAKRFDASNQDGEQFGTVKGQGCRMDLVPKVSESRDIHPIVSPVNDGALNFYLANSEAPPCLFGDLGRVREGKKIERSVGRCGYPRATPKGEHLAVRARLLNLLLNGENELRKILVEGRICHGAMVH
jgi:hypothetical protein